MLRARYSNHWTSRWGPVLFVLSLAARVALRETAGQTTRIVASNPWLTLAFLLGDAAIVVTFGIMMRGAMYL